MNLKRIGLGVVLLTVSLILIYPVSGVELFDWSNSFKNFLFAVIPLFLMGYGSILFKESIGEMQIFSETFSYGSETNNAEGVPEDSGDFDLTKEWNSGSGWIEESSDLWQGAIEQDQFAMEEGSEDAHYAKKFKFMDLTSLEIEVEIPDQEESNVFVEIATGNDLQAARELDKDSLNGKRIRLEPGLNEIDTDLEWQDFSFIKIITHRNDPEISSPKIKGVKIEASSEYSDFEDEFDQEEEEQEEEESEESKEDKAFEEFEEKFSAEQTGDFETLVSWETGEDWNVSEENLWQGSIQPEGMKVEDDSENAHYAKKFKFMDLTSLEIEVEIPDQEESNVFVEIATGNDLQAARELDKDSLNGKRIRLEPGLNEIDTDLEWQDFSFIKVILDRDNLEVPSPVIKEIKLEASEMDVQEEEKENDDREFECTRCGKGFRTDLGLKAHIKVEHEIEANQETQGESEDLPPFEDVDYKDLECPECGEEFKTDIGLKVHFQIKHSEKEEDYPEIAQKEI